MTSSRWKPGHVSLHDLSAAGRKSRKVSQWGRVPFTAEALKSRRLEVIRRAAIAAPSITTGHTERAGQFSMGCSVRDAEIEAGRRRPALCNHCDTTPTGA